MTYVQTLRKRTTDRPCSHAHLCTAMLCTKICTRSAAGSATFPCRSFSKQQGALARTCTHHTRSAGGPLPTCSDTACTACCATHTTRLTTVDINLKRNQAATLSCCISHPTTLYMYTYMYIPEYALSGCMNGPNGTTSLAATGGVRPSPAVACIEVAGSATYRLHRPCARPCTPRATYGQGPGLHMDTWLCLNNTMQCEHLSKGGWQCSAPCVERTHAPRSLAPSMLRQPPYTHSQLTHHLTT